MNLALHLPPETVERLKQRAQEAGQAPEVWALQALQDRLEAEGACDASLPKDAWLAAFDDWVASHKSRNPHFDDSRESIYSDR